MKPPSFLLFDLGGVLIDFAGFEHLNRLLPRPLDMATLKRRWLNSAAVRQFELGRTSPREFAETFLDEWQLSLAPPEFIALFVDWIKGFYPGACELLRDLKKHYRLGCLSNSNALHWAKLDGFDGIFDIALSSHLLGAIKPDRAAFERALEVCEVAPNDIVYFDDAPANVQAAQALSIAAFHVDGFAALQNVLREQRLMPKLQ